MVGKSKMQMEEEYQRRGSKCERLKKRKSGERILIRNKEQTRRLQGKVLFTSVFASSFTSLQQDWIFVGQLVGPSVRLPENYAALVHP